MRSTRTLARTPLQRPFWAKKPTLKGSLPLRPRVIESDASTTAGDGVVMVAGPTPGAERVTETEKSD